MKVRISTNSAICHGEACISGTRVPVHQVLRMLANGDSVESLLESYPNIRYEDVMACLDYAATLAEEQITPIDKLVRASA